MSNYTKTTDFDVKDSLPSGDTGKIIRGSEFEVEFENIEVAIASKADSLNAVLTGNTSATNLSVTGNTTLGNAATDTVTVNADFSSDLLPSADATYDLGAVGSEWQDLYITGTANIDSLVADTVAISGGTVTATLTGNVTGDLTGTVLTAAQPNITSLGTLTSASISGDLVVDTNTLFVDSANNVVNTAGNVVISKSNPALQFTPTNTSAFIDQNTTNGTLNFRCRSAAGTLNTLAQLFNDDVILQPNGNGNVGIGTSAPAAKLDVADSLNPTIRLKSTLVGNDPDFDDQYMGGLEWYTSDTSGIGPHIGASIRAFSDSSLTSTTPAYALTFSTSRPNAVESERMRIDADGNVGIGTTGPSSKLQVADGATDRVSIDVDGVVSTLSLGNVNTGAGNFVTSYNRTTGILTASIGPKGSENGAFSIVSDGNITFDGNLGIGVNAASPTELLLAESPSDTEASFLIRAGSTATSSLVDASLKLFARSSNNAQARTRITAIGTGGQASHLTFNTEFGGSLTEKVRIEAGGNVGIGTDAPSRKLSVRDVTATPFISIVGSTSSVPGLLFGDTDSDSIGQIRYDNTDNSMEFTAGNIMSLRLQSDGNVLIGKIVKQTQTSGLDVEQITSTDGDGALGLKSGTSTTTGNAFINCFLQNGVGSGRIESNGANALGFGAFSDLALKENIENLPPQLANVMQLRPVEFDYKDGSGHQIGFIAQEVEQVWPDLVSGEEGLKSIVGLGKTEARLIKALQEQQIIIEDLKARIATLEAN